MKKYFVAPYIALMACVFLSSCSDDEEENGTEVISALTIEANKFVYNCMNTYYYWVNYMPDINYETQSSTVDYFEELLYEGDQFSFITDDAEAYLEQIEGASTSKGWLLTYSYIDEDNSVVGAIVNYVYSGTPAYAAGAHRGDVIYKVGGTMMTADNYSSLMALESADYTALRYDGSSYDEVEYSVASAEIEVSMVAESSIFSREGATVGYILYNNFYSAFNEEFSAVVDSFRSNGVTELILDLRYNTGGEMSALDHVASLLAPSNVVASAAELVYYKYNDLLSAQEGYTRKESADYFLENLAAESLNLSRVYALVGYHTYSAAEAIVWALKPYMEVTTLGVTTGGKNTAMFVLRPSYFYNSRTNEPYYDEAIDNYLIAPIVAQYFNSEDETFDTTDGDGFSPDYEVNEMAFDDMGELGDASEPLTAAALELIDGNSLTTLKSGAVRKVIGSNRPAGIAIINMR